MANVAQYRDKAIAQAKVAIGLDRSQQYEEALSQYKVALEYFMFVIKYETNASIKETMKQKFNEYCSRAEEIQKFLDGQRQPQRAAPQLASGGGGGGEDEEQKKLQGALASAIVTEKPNIQWDDVAGLDLAKESLHEAIIYPTRFPELFVGKRQPWKGILLYGPPGTGKTHLAKACATEADATFFSVSSSDLVSKFMGESERLVKELFGMAREQRPSIIFIDEIDSLCSSRSEGENDATRRIKTEFLVQMQGLGHQDEGVLVLGATNVPWELDPAVRRRFSKRIYIPLPDAAARAILFKISLGSTPSNLVDADFLELGTVCEGFSGSDISIVSQEALYEPLRKCRNATHFKPINEGTKTVYTPCPPSDPQGQQMTMMQVPPGCLKAPDVSKNDFLEIFESRAKATVSAQDLTRYTNWTAEFG